MYVYIGPYIYRWTMRPIEDLWSKMRFGRPWDEVEENEYKRIDKWFEDFSNIGQNLLNATVNKIKDKQGRRTYIHIDYYDVWSADVTLAMIIHPTLMKLKKQMHGAGQVDDEDVPEELRRSSAPPVEYECDTDDNFFKRWDWVLDEMIWAFGHIADESWEEEYYDGKMSQETYDEIHARIKRGTMLFGKYFRSLWD